jgi:glycosyltransferase involved in cell wall biosynthesis
MSEPISVVMAVFNGRRYLAEQVDSILSQLEGEDELVIVDDASTDDGVAALQISNLDRVNVIRNHRNIGVFGTFQRGLTLARHDIVFLSDQDDVWLPGKRSAFAREFVSDPAVCLVISDAEVIDATGRLTAASFMATRGGFDGSLIGTLWRNRYLGCAMAVRKRLLDIALPIPRLVPMHDMWLGLIGRSTGRVVYLPKPYLRYRRHGNNLAPDRSRSPWRLLRWRAALLSMLGLRLLAVRSGFHARPATHESKS